MTNFPETLNINSKMLILYENIEKILPNKLHGRMHCKKGDTCVCNGQVFCTLL